MPLHPPDADAGELHVVAAVQAGDVVEAGDAARSGRRVSTPTIGRADPQRRAPTRRPPRTTPELRAACSVIDGSPSRADPVDEARVEGDEPAQAGHLRAEPGPSKRMTSDEAPEERADEVEELRDLVGSAVDAVDEGGHRAGSWRRARSALSSRRSANVVGDRGGGVEELVEPARRPRSAPASTSARSSVMARMSSAWSASVLDERGEVGEELRGCRRRGAAPTSSSSAGARRWCGRSRARARPRRRRGVGRS